MSYLFDDLVETLFGDTRSTWGRSFVPALDVAEADGDYIVRMDLPGVKEEDLNIEMRDNLLTIRGHREFEYNDNVNGLTRMERGTGTFQRSISLPRGVGEIDAKLENGVLTLQIEKPAEAQPRRIEIRSDRLIEA